MKYPRLLYFYFFAVQIYLLIAENNLILRKIVVLNFHLGSFKKYVRWGVEEGGGGVIEKRTKTNRGRWGPSMCVSSLLKKNAEIFKMKFYSYNFIVFLLIIMAVGNINKPSWKIIIFSPVNEWCAIAFASPHNIKITIMWVMLKIFIYNLLRSAKYQCKGVVKFSLSDLFFWDQFRRSWKRLS